ncbi:MAG: trypsin-like serine protease [Sandaracinus sp.]
MRYPLTARYFAGVVVLLSCSEQARDPEHSEVVAASTMSLTLDGSPRCLATILRTGLALTAQHCVEEPGAPAAIGADRLLLHRGSTTLRVSSVVLRIERYEILADLSGRDLALLVVEPGEGYDGLAGGGRVLRGDIVFASTGVERVGLRSGRVRVADGQTIYTDPLVCDGDSGGALVDQSGALVGVASWRSAECGAGSSVFTRVDAHDAWLGPFLTREPIESGR